MRFARRMARRKLNREIADAKRVASVAAEAFTAADEVSPLLDEARDLIAVAEEHGDDAEAERLRTLLAHAEAHLAGHYDHISRFADRIAGGEA